MAARMPGKRPCFPWSRREAYKYMYSANAIRFGAGLKFPRPHHNATAGPQASAACLAAGLLRAQLRVHVHMTPAQPSSRIFHNYLDARLEPPVSVDANK